MSRAVVLTAARQRVADCMARGLSYAQTAVELGIRRDTVKAHVFAIAQRIPNPHGLPQKVAILRWLQKTTKPGVMRDAAQPGIHTVQMSTRPLTICSERGCPRTANAVTRYCDQHKHRARVHPNGQRLSPRERLYDHRWRVYSKAYVETHPYCSYCGEPTTCVDHVIAPRGDQELFWDPTNHTPACSSCNSAKAVREEGAGWPSR